MRISTPTRSILALLAAIVSFTTGSVSHAAQRVGDEPSTTTIRIRLKGPTLRVRCRHGDCAITIVQKGTAFAVSVTRTRDGVPFTFERTVHGPTNVAVETGVGNDTISLVDVVVPGFLRIGSGFGEDVLDLSNLSAAAKVSIDTGPGADTVRLEPGIFGGKFRLHSRGGNDDVSLTGGRFDGKAFFDGGPGTDTFSAPSDPFTQPPAIIGFEPATTP